MFEHRKSPSDRARNLGPASLERLEQRIVFALQLGPTTSLNIPSVDERAAEFDLPPSIEFQDTRAFEHSSSKLSGQAVDALIGSVSTWKPTEVGKHDFPGGANFWRKAPSGYAPEVTEEGVLIAKRFERNTDPHTMVTAGIRGSECFHTGGFYTQQDYHYRFSFDIRHPTSETSWLNDHAWAIVMQLWGPRESNETARNPPFSIYSRSIDGTPHWIIRSYGDARLTTQTGQFQEIHQQRIVMTGIGDWHTFDVEFVPNPFGNGLVRTWLDGVLIAEWKDIKNSYYSMFDGRPTGPLNPGFGLYSSMDEDGMEVHMDNISIDCSGRFESSIAGTVSGTGDLDGVLVVATDRATGKSYGARTNAAGVYTLAVPKGSFSITAADEASGYRATTLEVSTLESSQLVNLKLRPSDAVLQQLRSFSADVTGNRKSEIINQLSDGSWQVSVANGDATYSTSVWEQWSTDVDWHDVHVADFTGDGRDDIIGRDSNGLWHVSSSSGGEFETRGWGKWTTARTWVYVSVGDFNGDGLADVAGRDQASGDWWVSLSVASGFITRRWGRWTTSIEWLDVSVGDFDGDGRSDIAGRSKKDGTWWVSRSEGTRFQTDRWGNWSPSGEWSDVLVGDFDGDGVSDLTGRNGSEWWVSLSNGKSFENHHWASWATTEIWSDIVVADVNGDRRSDLIGRIEEDGTWWAARSHGDRFESYYWGGDWPTGEDLVSAHVDDFDGDGALELLGATPTTWLLNVCCSRAVAAQAEVPPVESPRRTRGTI